MYILIEGNAEVMIGGMSVESAGPGAILGEMALVSNTGRSATVMARTACRVLAVNAERFDALIHEKPGFARHVMRVMAERLQHMNEKLLQATHPEKK
jgi:CRP-like cAMP-binding protein